jgi:hypothetical protein
MPHWRFLFPGLHFVQHFRAAPIQEAVPPRGEVETESEHICPGPKSESLRREPDRRSERTRQRHICSLLTIGQQKTRGELRNYGANVALSVLLRIITGVGRSRDRLTKITLSPGRPSNNY